MKIVLLIAALVVSNSNGATDEIQQQQQQQQKQQQKARGAQNSHGVDSRGGRGLLGRDRELQQMVMERAYRRPIEINCLETLNPVPSPTNPPSDPPSKKPSNSPTDPPTNPPTTTAQGAACSTCERDASGISFAGNPKDAIFNQMSALEVQSIMNYLKQQSTITYLAREVFSVNTALNSNFGVFVQLYPPKKADAIAYLDNTDNSVAVPDRYAIVTVHRGAATPRDVMQYKVGPILNSQVTAGATIEPMLADNEIPWAKRGNYAEEYIFLRQAVVFQGAKLSDLLESTTQYCYGRSLCGNNINYIDSASLASTPERRITTVRFVLAPNSEPYGYRTLMPIPLSFSFVEDPDSPPRDWETFNYEYCGQGPYDSAEALMDAYNDFSLEICRMSNSGMEWTNTDPVFPLRQGSTIPEPKSFHSTGRRFRVESSGSSTSARNLAEDKDEIDEEELGHGTKFYNYEFEQEGTTESKANKESTLGSSAKAEKEASAKTKKEQKKRKLQNAVGGDGAGHMVSWMDWSFHASVDAMHGLVLRDITFKGERIAYELSFQEYFASYSALGSHAEVFYFDSAFQIGNLSPLELGVDCPEDALLLPMAQQSRGRGFLKQDVMCIFEQPHGEAMWRHHYTGNFGAYKTAQVGGIPRTSLQVKITSTMGNYDYIPKVLFMADGVMEVKLEMGGFLQGGWAPDPSDPNAEVPKFGSQVRDSLIGLLHDHMIGVKVDFDVGGTSNKFVTGKVQYGTHQQATGKAKPGWHSYDGIKYMNFTTLETEGGVMTKDYDSLIVESNEVNKWGEKKSLEIHFDHTVGTQLYPPDHPIGATTEWQRSNIAVTKQKDEERYCSFPSNHQLGAAFPSFDLKKFKNGESIVDEDLVLWMMFGVQHYPKAEDIPLVSNFGSGFIVKPRNYFDRAAFEDLADNRNVQDPTCVPPSIF